MINQVFLAFCMNNIHNAKLFLIKININSACVYLNNNVET